MSRVKDLEDELKIAQSEKVDGLMSRVKDLEDELKVTQSEKVDGLICRGLRI